MRNTFLMTAAAAALIGTTGIALSQQNPGGAAWRFGRCPERTRRFASCAFRRPRRVATEPLQ